MHTGVHSKFKDVFHFKESCLCNAQTFSSIFKTNARPFNVIFTSTYLFWFCVCIARRFYSCTYGLYAFKPSKFAGVYSKVWILRHFTEFSSCCNQLPNLFWICVVQNTVIKMTYFGITYIFLMCIQISCFQILRSYWEYWGHFHVVIIV